MSDLHLGAELAARYGQYAAYQAAAEPLFGLYHHHPVIADHEVARKHVARQIERGVLPVAAASSRAA